MSAEIKRQIAATRAEQQAAERELVAVEAELSAYKEMCARRDLVKRRMWTLEVELEKQRCAMEHAEAREWHRGRFFVLIDAHLDEARIYRNEVGGGCGTRRELDEASTDACPHRLEKHAVALQRILEDPTNEQALHELVEHVRRHLHTIAYLVRMLEDVGALNAYPPHRTEAERLHRTIMLLLEVPTFGVAAERHHADNQMGF